MSTKRTAYWRDYARARRAAGRKQGPRSNSHRAYLRDYYYAHQPEMATARFERKIQHLPEHVKEMRRILRRLKLWCKAHGYTLRNLSSEQPQSADAVGQR